VLVMTSNVGADELSRRRPGFLPDDRIEEDDRALRSTFSPEFRNRLDARIPFAPLSREVMERIVERSIGQLNEQLAPKRIAASITPAARAWLAEHGHEPL